MNSGSHTNSAFTHPRERTFSSKRPRALKSRAEGLRSRLFRCFLRSHKRTLQRNWYWWYFYISVLFTVYWASCHRLPSFPYNSSGCLYKNCSRINRPAPVKDRSCAFRKCPLPRASTDFPCRWLVGTWALVNEIVSRDSVMIS